MPSRGVDVLPYKADTAIHENDIDTSAMEAPGGKGAQGWESIRDGTI